MFLRILWWYSTNCYSSVCVPCRIFTVSKFVNDPISSCISFLLIRIASVRIYNQKNFGLGVTLEKILEHLTITESNTNELLISIVQSRIHQMELQYQSSGIISAKKFLAYLKHDCILWIEVTWVNIVHCSWYRNILYCIVRHTELASCDEHKYWSNATTTPSP